MTPPVVQQVVDGGSAGYHGYWGLDFLNVDPHLGTNADFGAFVACAHTLGLKVIMDVVVNHTGDIVRLGGGSSYSDAPYRNCAGAVFNPARYVRAAKFPCLRARDMPRVPFVLSGDTRAKSPSWLNDPLNYHDRGDINFGSCSEACFEQGDFYGLDDLFTEKPAVMKGLAAVYAGWIQKYKLDGFRVDTARHVNADFFRLWVPRIRAAARAAGVPGFQIFGEVPLDDAVDLAPYVRDQGLPNVLDFPLQSAATDFVAASSSAKAVASRLADDDYFRLADGVDPAPPTFLGNHDMGRAAQQIRSRMQPDDGALLQRTLLGYDLLYLLRGAPVVYYGDEVGMIGSGGDKAAREDMFPTQVVDWQTEPRLGSPPIGKGSSFDVRDNPIELRLKQLAALRDATPALATGPTIVRRDAGRLLVISRIDTGERREYVAALNAGTEPVQAAVRTATPSSAWQPLLGASGGDEQRRRLSDPDRAAALHAAAARGRADPGRRAESAGAEGRPRRSDRAAPLDCVGVGDRSGLGRVRACALRRAVRGGASRSTTRPRTAPSSSPASTAAARGCRRLRSSGRSTGGRPRPRLCRSPSAADEIKRPACVESHAGSSCCCDSRVPLGFMGRARIECDGPGRDRTCDLGIKSPLLYQLSYRPARLHVQCC